MHVLNRFCFSAEFVPFLGFRSAFSYSEYMETNRIQPADSSRAAPVIPYSVNPAACVACGRCRRICPADAIVITDISAIIQENCIGCGKCESVCPASAIHKNRR